MAMKTVGQVIRSRRQELGLTLQGIASIAGCTKGYLSTIENPPLGEGDEPGRGTRTPSPELLEKLEVALRMAPGSLVFAGSMERAPEDVRRRVIDLEKARRTARELARLISANGTSGVGGVGGVDALHRSGKLRALVEALEHDGSRVGATEPRTSPVVSILPLHVPVINKVAAGYPAEFTDLGYPARVADDYVSVPDVHDADAFAARVVGESMEPLYREGDIVVFSPLAPTKPGCDCFVRLEGAGESTFKRVYFEKDDAGRELIRLQPLNPSFAPRLVEREEVGGMYAAVYVVRAVGEMAR